MERIIEVSDPVYTFHEVMSHIDLYKYLADEERRTGRPTYDFIKLMNDSFPTRRPGLTHHARKRHLRRMAEARGAPADARKVPDFRAFPGKKKRTDN